MYQGTMSLYGLYYACKAAQDLQDPSLPELPESTGDKAFFVTHFKMIMVWSMLMQTLMGVDN